MLEYLAQDFELARVEADNRRLKKELMQTRKELAAALAALGEARERAKRPRRKRASSGEPHP